MRFNHTETIIGSDLSVQAPNPPMPGASLGHFTENET